MISSLKSKFNLFDSRAIFLSSGKLAVYFWHRGRLGSSYLFNNDEAGQEKFVRYIEATPPTPVYVLVDIMEEEFRTDTIPHVFGADRRALIKRKQSRLFKETRYFYTQIQEREQQGRRDDKVLFTALSRQDIIQPWLQILEKHKVPLAGVISLPLLSGSFLKFLPDVSEHVLVVSMQSISGLRQTFFHQQKLKISRLTKLPRYGTASYTPRIFSEVGKIHRYLRSLRMISIQQPLDIYFLAHNDLLFEVRQQAEQDEMVRNHLIDLDSLARRMGIEKQQITPFSDQIFITHLLSEVPPNAYALPTELRYNKMRKLRYAMNVASVLLATLAVVYSSSALVGGFIYGQQSVVASQRAEFYTDRYELARKQLPQIPVEPAQLKVAVDALATLDEYKSTPVKMMRFLGASLLKFPRIHLQQIDWAASMEPDVGTDAITDEIEDVNIDNGSKARYYQIATINARLQPFDGDYRAAIAMVNEFAEALRQDESVYRVTILTLPLDVSSGGSLREDVKNVGSEAEFSLRAVLGIYDETG